MSPSPDPAVLLRRYRPWLLAAAAYNLAWGTVNVVAPDVVFAVLGIPRPTYMPLWQVVGMLVLLYGIAYWWAARDPLRHRHLVAIGLLGKVGGLLGFAWALATGGLPASFGAVVLLNDLIWLPALGSCVWQAAGGPRGLRRLLVGL